MTCINPVDSVKADELCAEKENEIQYNNSINNTLDDVIDFDENELNDSTAIIVQFLSDNNTDVISELQKQKEYYIACYA